MVSTGDENAFLAGKRAAEKVQELERQKSMRKLMAPAWAIQPSQAQGD